ncbi:MAG: terpene cyclase/mutase family protein [Pirellulales bacterium]|nr:terpene cyclase/mutase family protein [Pirellulales bacterium]
MKPLFDSIGAFLASVPWMWIALWLGIAGLALTLLILMLTRWGQSDPMRKCIVMALLAHVLLAGYATTVQIVASSGNPRSREPITMVFVDLPPEVPTNEEVPQEPEDQPPEEEAPEKPVEPDIPADEINGSWSLGPGEPRPRVTNSPTTQRTASARPRVSRHQDTTPRPELQQLDVAPQSLDVTSAQPVAPTPPVASRANPTMVRSKPAKPRSDITVAAVARPLTSAYRSRSSEQRQAMVEKFGGSHETEAAVAAAIAWLAKQQQNDGHWSAARSGAGREQKIAGHDRSGAGAKADTGITSLAILAMLGAGHTHKGGPYAENVKAGLEYLIAQQGADGNLYGNAGAFARMYCHAMATFALSEAYAMTRDKALRPTVERAVAFSIKCQNPTTGGWRYRPGDTGDTSQLGWQLMALRSASLAGIEVPRSVADRASRFLGSVASGRAGGLAGYRPGQLPTRTMTAEALFCRQLLATQRSSGANTEAGQYLLQTLPGEMLPGEATPNLYYWYYGTVSMFQMQGVYWRQWNPALKRALLKMQNDDGSWPVATRWGGHGGKIYTTAMGAMCLEVYYRYLPFYREAKDVARRPRY